MRGHVAGALQLSVMAGIRSDAIVAATGSERVVRAMPNTPALIGQGIAGAVRARGGHADDRADGRAPCSRRPASCVWVGDEADLDAVTALSGSGPAYVFYFVEAMMQAGRRWGCRRRRARRLAEQTVAGATALAAALARRAAELRANASPRPAARPKRRWRSLETQRRQAAFVAAVLAARERARELGDEFGRRAS